MEKNLSQRLAGIADALPFSKGIRILEIGCGPGALAREMAKRIDSGYILAIDRSSKAIQQATKNAKAEIQSGALAFRQVAVENFDLQKDEKPYDLAIAIRVGALDGRHSEIEQKALRKIATALTKKGKLYIDGGNPLKEISLEKYR